MFGGTGATPLTVGALGPGAGCEPTLTLPDHWPLLMSQRSILLVVGLYQTRSLLPSLLKSAAPSGCHPAGWEPTSMLPAHCPLTIFQMSTSPVVGLYHAMSLVPSPLKAPARTG